MRNVTNDWFETSPTYNLTYEIQIDGEVVAEGYDESAPFDMDRGRGAILLHGGVPREPVRLLGGDARHDQGQREQRHRDRHGKPDRPVRDGARAGIGRLRRLERHDLRRRIRLRFEPARGLHLTERSTGEADWGFYLLLRNVTNDWFETSPTYNLTYEIQIDGEVVAEGYDESAPYPWIDGTGQLFFSTEDFLVSPYDCSVVMLGTIKDNESSVIETVTANLTAPCETVPEPTLVGFDAWNDMTFDGVYVYDSNLLEGSISQSDLPGEPDWRFYLLFRNVTNDWFDTSPTYNLTYEIQIDGEVVAEGYDESAPFDWDYIEGGELFFSTRSSS